jgi:predicted RNA-binding Zn-ribbon protein involved in translation (DUF1610 family)
MLVKCDGKDGCNQEFNLEKIEVTKLDNDIEKTYFVCPHCGKEYVAFYTDKHIRKKQAIIRGLKSPSAIEQLRKEIAKDMKRLRKKVESK